MEEYLNILSNYGGLVILAGLFLYVFFTDKKERKEEKEANQKLLSEVSASNRNIAESLNLLKMSMDNTNNEFRQHDERAIKQFNRIHEDLLILKERK